MRLRDRRVKDRHPLAVAFRLTNHARSYRLLADLISLSAPGLVNTLSFIAESRRRSLGPATIIASDALLVGVAVLVIALSYSPAPPSRQLIWYRSESGGAECCSLAVDDPQLPKLRAQMRLWHQQRPADTLGVTRWQQETARFYVDQLTPIDSPIAQVSFDSSTLRDSLSGQSSIGNGPATPQFWTAVSEQCEQILQQRAEQLALLKRQRGEPPMVFGQVVAGGSSPQTFGICMAFGVLAAMVFSVWAKLLPTLELTGHQDAKGIIERDATTDLRLVIPRHWVRIRQPAGVRIRQLTYAAVVLCALICSLP